MNTHNQRAKVLPVIPNPLRVGGRKDRNGCEFGGIFDLVGTKTGNTSGLKVLPNPGPQGSVNVVYIPDQNSQCPTICGSLLADLVNDGGGE
jgi:hypothetical protein